MYDLAIIGAGINGASVAYEFENEGLRVLVLDKEGIAGGGSGAAGAFISPKFSKSGELKELLHEAFVYSMDFYEKNFEALFKKRQLIHLAKDEKDAEALRVYRESTSLKLLNVAGERREYVSIYSGIVDAKAMCQAMLKSATLKTEEVTTLEYSDGCWLINETYTAKEIVLATGAYKSLLSEPYISLRGVWGHRIDIKSSTKNPYLLHQFVSISPNEDGTMAIGATHNVHYHPDNTHQTYDVNAAREELLKKASQTMELREVEILKDYMGLRSGSHDYMPLLGKVVLSSETLQNRDIRFKVKDADYSKYSYYPNLYMINGSGGYGFVLAPYLAKMLKAHIVQSQEISKRVSPARFFARWAKKDPTIS